jgi:cob(I)alamin adenosyltransferase
MKIYTKSGDQGETGLFGGKRVSKGSLRIDSYGTIDELNSFIGVAIVETKNEEIIKLLQKLQNQLFEVGSDLASPDDDKAEKFNILRIPEKYYEDIEKQIDYFDDQLEPLRNFILPGGSKGAAYLHVCRTIARRAERLITLLSVTEKVNGNIIIFLNRLSDLFFVLARFENMKSAIKDIKWEK